MVIFNSFWTFGTIQTGPFIYLINKMTLKTVFTSGIMTVYEGLHETKMYLGQAC